MPEPDDRPVTPDPERELEVGSPEPIDVDAPVQPDAPIEADPVDDLLGLEPVEGGGDDAAVGGLTEPTGRAEAAVPPDPTEPVDPADPVVREAEEGAGGAVTVPPAPAQRRSGSRTGVILGAAVLVLALVLGGLAYATGAGSSDPAFTVYGEETSREELAERLDGLVSDEVLDTLGDDDATPEQQAQLAEAMSTLITLDVLSRAAEDEDVTVTEEDVDTQVDEVVATGFGGDREAFDTQLAQAGITVDTVRTQFRTALLAEALVADEVDPVDSEEVRAAYDAQFNLPTVSHILTETAEDAQAALDRIENGEAFADVAAEVSTDPASGAQGGELGPFQPGTLPPEMEAAALELETGEVSEVVETQFGFHLITVGDPLPFEDVEAQLMQAVEDRSLAETFTRLAERLEVEAEITVDPVFGEWTGLTGGGLVPPGAATADPLQVPPPPPGG